MRKQFTSTPNIAVGISACLLCISAVCLFGTHRILDSAQNNYKTRVSLLENCENLFTQAQANQIPSAATSQSNIMEAAIHALTKEEINTDLLNAAAGLSSIGDSQIQQRVAEYKAKQASLPDPSVAAQMASRPGMIGRLTIPSLGVNVALFASNSQAVVDASDSAAYFNFGSIIIIGDHQNQGFSAIRGAAPGAVAYIDNGQTKRKLVCTGRSNGTNTGADLLDSSGASVSTRGGYVMYTCNSNWNDVTLAFFS